jgi:hypothetical protein
MHEGAFNKTVVYIHTYIHRLEMHEGALKKPVVYIHTYIHTYTHTQAGDA